MLCLWQFYSNNVLFLLSSMSTYNRSPFVGISLLNAVYDNFIYNYKYVTDFVNADIKLWNQ